MPTRHANKKGLCPRCEVGLEGSNWGYCPDCQYEMSTGRMIIDPPVIERHPFIDEQIDDEGWTYRQHKVKCKNPDCGTLVIFNKHTSGYCKACATLMSYVRGDRKKYTRKKRNG